MRSLKVPVYLALLLLVGCYPLNLVTGSGDVITEEMDVAGFSSVDVSNAFEVDVSQADAYSVAISADDNLFDYINVEREGSTLRIYLDRGMGIGFGSATLRATVTMPEIEGLTLSGASQGMLQGFDSDGDLEIGLSGASRLTGDIRAGDTRMDISGASRVELAGGGTDLDVNASGASRVDLAEYPVENASVEFSGASNGTVHVTGSLDYEVSGASNLEYLGDPDIGRSETSGASSARGQ